MSKSNHRNAFQGQPKKPLQQRPGEGAQIDVAVQKGMSVSGQSLTGMSFDFRDAPVPDRKYVAGIYRVEFTDDEVRLLFGQRKYGAANELRNLLVIHLSGSCVQQFLRITDEMTSPTYLEIAAVTNIKPTPMFTLDKEPENTTVELAANLMISAMSGDEAVLDLYKYSPFSILAVQHGARLALDPIVRIDLRSTLFLGLLSELRKIAPDLPQVEVNTS